MKNFILLITLLIVQSVVAQSPIVEWKKTFGGSLVDTGTCIQQTNDGGYIVAGRSGSINGDVTGNHGMNDFWILKLDSEGNINWQKSFGGSSSETARSIRQTSDGGYVVVGVTSSNDLDIIGFHGASDLWLIKLNQSGNLIWQKTLGGSGEDSAVAVEEASDGGFFITGSTNSDDGDVSGTRQSFDYWVIRTNSVGAIEWQRTLGGTANDLVNSFCLTDDGGCIVIGLTQSNDGDVTENFGNDDCLIVKLSSSGDTQWIKMLGGTNIDNGNSIKQTTDGGYIVGGSTQSGDGDGEGNHGSSDFWIVKLDSNGQRQWHKTFGGTDAESALCIQQITNGSFILAGWSHSFDGNVSLNHGSEDWWIINVNESGDLLWEKVLGGSASDWCNYLEQTIDGGLVLAGYTQSTNGDILTNHGVADYWVVKLDGSILENETFSHSKMAINLFPNPATDIINISLNFSSSVKIIDQVGKVLYKNLPNTNHTINVSSLSAGIYTVETQYGKTVKFLKR